ncbi:MAG: hypothetical protein N5P05_002284 [Chroococcopsis gigantea SAG 12.99]|jgi:DNA-binding NarL/FixJ family response regulator|nr:response regulator [Chlorogloea purpurea SAG 13.99]MDV3000678.1 hypothetical protein [Chroococcopsis gigantea SAG 12.99]
MPKNICQVLLIEDDLTTVKLIEELILKAPLYSLGKDLSFALTPVDSMESGLAALVKNKFDVLLLGLKEREQRNLTNLITLREIEPHLPIIVHTKDSDESLIVKAFQMGADGYIESDNLDSKLLVYQVRVAIERQAYIKRLEEQQQQKQQEREFLELEHLINNSSTSITARMFGSETLKESVPDIFHEFVLYYGDLLDLALQQRMYKVEYNLSEQLRSMADKLGFLKASPRDIVDIHTTSLKEKNQNVKLAKAQAYVVEGRLIVLELMGYLASFYRKYYIGLSNINLAVKLKT